jgi:hypothetical protein
MKDEIKNIKEDVTKNMENLRKKDQIETKNTVECYSSRQEQVEDRISELQDKIEIKEKKQKKSQSYNSRAVKGKCKNSATPSKDQT